MRCADGALAGAARVLVAVADVNDHAPTFAQRYYELRVPEPAPRAAAARAQVTGLAFVYDRFVCTYRSPRKLYPSVLRLNC